MAKKTILTLIFICVLISTSEATLFERLFGRLGIFNQPIDAKQELIKSKNAAYAKWQESSKDVIDFSNTAWEKLYDAYEVAWNTYQETKLKILELVGDTQEIAHKDYEEAKKIANESIQKVVDYLSQYKEKAEEKLSDVFFDSLEKLEDTVNETEQKYFKARDSLSKLYDSAYEEAVEDYSAAAQYLFDTSDRFKRFTEKEVSQQKKEVIKKLEDAKDKAKTNYAETKKKYQDIRGKVETFNTDIADYAKSGLQFVKQRAEDSLNAFNSYTNLGDKTSEKYNQVLQRLQKAKDKSSQRLKEAEESVELINKRIANFVVDTISTVRQKYQDLKDEL